MIYHGFEGKSNRSRKDCRETDPWLKVRCRFPDEDRSRALRDERNAGPRYSPELMSVPRVKLKVGPCFAPLDMPYLRLPRDFLFLGNPITSQEKIKKY